MIDKWSVKDYDTATTWLQEGRKKYIRPLYMRGLYMSKISNGDIVITDKWASFNPVVFHRDGTKTIQAPVINRPWGSWNSLNSQTVRYNILQFSGIAQIYQKNFECHLVFQDALTTKPKVQGCRMCSRTGLLDGWCHPPTCWDGERGPNNVYVCSKHPNVTPLHSYSRYHNIACEHGQEDSHATPKTEKCHSCSGMGMRDYGSKLISLIWDGSPLRIKDGSLVKQPPTELEKRIAAYVQPIS
jgi:hypothetical protein